MTDITGNYRYRSFAVEMTDIMVFLCGNDQYRSLPMETKISKILLPLSWLVNGMGKHPFTAQ